MTVFAQVGYGSLGRCQAPMGARRCLIALANRSSRGMAQRVEQEGRRAPIQRVGGARLASDGRLRGSGVPSARVFVPRHHQPSTKGSGVSSDMLIQTLLVWR